MPIKQSHAPLTITKEAQADLIRRALATWYGSVQATPPEAQGKPVAGRIATKPGKPTEDGNDPRPLYFVVLHAGAVVLAVFRVRQVKDYLMLRRMLRPPKDLVRLKG